MKNVIIAITLAFLSVTSIVTPALPAGPRDGGGLLVGR